MLKMRVKMFKVNNSFIKNQCYLIHKNNIGILIDPAWDYNLINDFSTGISKALTNWSFSILKLSRLGAILNGIS